MKWKYIFAAGVSLVFLWLAFRQFDFGEAHDAIAAADLRFVLPALAAYLVSFIVRTYRWQIMLKPVRSLPLKNLFQYLVIGYTANNLLPARLGEFVRAYVTGQREGISRTSAFASVVLERIFDGATIVFVLVLLMFAGSVDWPVLRATAWTGAIVFSGGLAFLFALAYQRDRALKLARAMLSKLPKKLARTFDSLLVKFLSGLDLLRHPSRFIGSFMLSFCVWAAEGAVYYFYLQAFHLDAAPWHAAALALVAVNLSGMIPSSPGMIGVFQFFCQQALFLYGIPKSTGLTLSVAVHATQIVPITLLGLIFLSKMGLNLMELGKADISENGEGESKMDNASSDEYTDHQKFESR